MEHTCEKCGKPVEDGTPFCPECGAPQIRVHVEPEEPATPPMPPGTPEQMQPPAEPVSLRDWQQSPTQVSSTQVDWRSALPGTVAAGVLAGLGTMIPFLPFMALCMIASGGLAVTFYRRRSHAPEIIPGQGFRVGALAGFFGFLLNASFSGVGMLSASNRALLRSAMQDRLHEALANNPDPAAQQMAQRFTDSISTTGGLLAFFAFGMLVFLILFVLLGGAGGALGARLFGRRPSNI